MSWAFRRRIKIADGVHLNLSRRGVSMTVGPRGAKVTYSPKGMYYHLGLPGTGIYSRHGVSFKAKKKRLAKLARQRQLAKMEYYSNLERINDGLERANKKLDAFNKKHFPAEETKKGAVGCLLVLLWPLFIASLLLFIMSIDIIVNDGIHDYTIFGLVLCVSLSFLLGFLIMKVKHKQTALRRRWNGEIVLIPDVFMRGLRNQINSSKNELKKPILENFLGKAIREQADNELRPLIDKCLLKLEKKHNPRVQRRMDKYKAVLERQYAEATSLTHDFIAELTDKEAMYYNEFCNAYQGLLNSKKKWLVAKEEQIANQKSSVDSVITTIELSFGVGDFWAIDIPYDYPTIPVSENIRFCFFPRFVIEEDLRHYGEFKVYSIKDIIMLYEECRFHETEEIPEDAELIETTYEYVNKDGTPDLRYTNNPMMSVVMYGNITIMPFNYTLQFSNNNAAKEFADAFVKLVSVTPDTTALGDILTAKKVVDPARPLVIDNIHPRFERAARTVVLNQRAHVSDLQRNFDMSDSEASEVMQQLESAGIVGKGDGAHPRAVLIRDLAELDEILQSIQNL